MPKAKAYTKPMELHAPKVKSANVLVNLVVRGEPQPWKRVTQSRFGKFRLVNPTENVNAQAKLRTEFEQAYPKFKPIEHRRLGVQLFFRTRYDSNDWDNMAKQVSDAFNGVIWSDDRIVKEGYVRVDVTSKEAAFTQIVVYLLEYGA